MKFKDENQIELDRQRREQKFLKKCEEKGLLYKVNIVSKYINTITPIKLQCKKHQNVYWEMKPHEFLKSTGKCIECKKENQKRIYKTHKKRKFLDKQEINNKLIQKGIDFELIDDYIKSDVKTRFKCKKCGAIREVTTHNMLRGEIHCQVCDDGISFPNKLVRYLLLELNLEDIKFEFNDTWSKKYRYDAYFSLNNKKYLIEADGGFHYMDFGKFETTLESRQKADKEKDLLAKENNYYLIRINCNEKTHKQIIKNIKNSELGKLFDLEKINWDSCLLKAENSLMKEVCDYFNTHENMSAFKIAKIFYLNPSTVIKYLKDGTNFNWCNYNPNLITKRKVIAYKNDKKEIVGIFSSIKKCSETIFKKYDIQITTGNITLVCQKKYKQIKGFTFEYLN